MRRFLIVLLVTVFLLFSGCTTWEQFNLSPGEKVVMGMTVAGMVGWAGYFCYIASITAPFPEEVLHD